MKAWVVAALAAAFLVGCSSNETNDKEKRGSTSEETRFVTQLVTVEKTVEETVEETTSVIGGACVVQERPPEDVLALQYEYINSGDFEEAYELFAEQSRREVSLAQYSTFFEDNAPYSVTDYSFVPVRLGGDSATVTAEFTVTSASGVERLERSQEFVCESGEWRVVMRPEQVAVFTAEEDDAEDDSTREPDTETRVRRARICRAVSLPNLQHHPLKARAPGLDLSLSRRLALPPCRLALLRRRLLSQPLLRLQRGM